MIAFGKKLADQMANLLRKNPGAVRLAGYKRPAASGFTMIELAMVVAIIGVLAAVVLGNMGTTNEARDASAVQSAQAALQQVIAQGSTRADTSPTDLVANQRANIINAANMLMQNRQDLRFSDSSPNFRLTIASSGRTATFSVTTNGDVTLQPLNAGQWVDYTVNNGVISRR